jgi:hypothetical protein
MTLFDLIDRMKDVPTDSLAEALREIHELRVARSDGVSRAPTSAIVPSRAAVEPRAVRAPVRRRREEAAIASIVSALKRVHERRQSAKRGGGSAGSTPGSPESPYDRVRRHFHEHEERLRRHAFVTDRVLDGLRGAGDGPLPAEGGALLQQELHLLCAVGAGTGGRFVTANESSRSLEVELRAGRVRGVPAGWGRHVSVRCEPTHFLLAAGEQRTVRLQVDLRDCPVQVGDRLGFTIDATGGGQLLQKVWVEIQMVAREADAAAGGESR